MPSESARRIIDAVDAARAELYEAVTTPAGAVSLPAGDGWTVQEMIGHVAFWEEAPYGVLNLMFRGTPLPDGWAFGSGYMPESEWPHFEVHNQREAAWARGQSWEAVLSRWDKAHTDLLTLLETVTDEEAQQHADYFSDVAGHLREHLDDFRAAQRLT